MAQFLARSSGSLPKTDILNICEFLLRLLLYVLPFQEAMLTDITRNLASLQTGFKNVTDLKSSVGAYHGERLDHDRKYKIGKP